MNSTGKEFTGLNFFLVLLGWAFVLAACYLVVGLFGYHSFDEAKSLHDVVVLLRSTIQQLFIHSDGWNLLILTTLVALGILTFSCNDFLLRLAWKKWIKLKATGFYSQGGIWLLRLVVNLVLSGIEFIFLCIIVNLFVSAPYLQEPNSLYGKKDVLLLGTSKYLRGTNSINIYYKQRIDCVVGLHKQGLVKRIILSGDADPATGYNEPADMAMDLQEAGISKSILLIDSHGHRTHDSILRYLALEDSDTVIIVSQLFHLQRALYLARQVGARAIGVSADGSMTQSMWVREIFAKSKIILDVYVLNTQAYGLRPENRRAISLLNPTDLVLLSLVSALVYIAGIFFRRVLFL